MKTAIEIVNALRTGKNVTFDMASLSDEVVGLLGGKKEDGWFGRDSNTGSPSSSGSNKSYYLLQDGSILEIGVPYDSFWFEAYLHVKGSPNFEYMASSKIGKIKHQDTCLECALAMNLPMSNE